MALIATLPASEAIGRIGCHTPFAFEMLHPAVQQLANLPHAHCKVRVEWGEHEFRNPSENWNMADQAQVIADILKSGGHTVKTSVAPVGSDWVCWRSQSINMWKFLLNPSND